MVETDSAAAKGTASRIGAGKKLRHLEVEQFFLQQLVKQGQVIVQKMKGDEQVWDIGTKHLAWPKLQNLLQMLNLKLLKLASASVLPLASGASPEIFDGFGLRGCGSKCNERLRSCVRSATSCVALHLL